MALVPAICTQCGAKIEVDDTHEAGVCKYCGTAFITEKAINQYTTYITNNNNFAGANINIMGANVDNLIVLAQNARDIGNYDEAKDYYSRVLEAQPTNCDALLGKGVCALYGSKLGDIKSDEFIGYVSKAIENKKKEQDATADDINEFIAKAAGTLYGAAVALYQAVQAHYNEFWKLQNSAPELWERLARIIKIFLFIITITDDEDVRKLENAEFQHKESMKFVCLCCVEICKQRQYVSGIINPGQLLETEQKSEIKPNQQVHQTYMDLYDNMCKKIKEIDPDYEPQETINRNKEIQGGCYVATCVYGSYDCPEVWTLRRFRDYTLDVTWYGRLFIKCYYAISPTVVKWFGETKWFKTFWKARLDKMVSNLNNKGVENTSYTDKY